MNNLKKVYKEKFDSIDLSIEKEKLLKEEIIGGYIKKQKNKKILSGVLIIFVVLIMGTGIAYAKEIKESINMLITSFYKKQYDDGSSYKMLQIESNAIKELNYEANLKEPKCLDNDISEDNECYSLYTYDELEKELDIKLLKSDLFKEKKFVLQSLDRIDGKISTVKLRLPDALKVNSEDSITKLDLVIIMRTKYSKEPTLKLGDGYYTEETAPKYYINNLKTTAYGIEFGKRRVVNWEYDDIIYIFKLNPYGEMRKDPDKAVQKILDSLHY